MRNIKIIIFIACVLFLLNSNLLAEEVIPTIENENTDINGVTQTNDDFNFKFVDCEKETNGDFIKIKVIFISFLKIANNYTTKSTEYKYLYNYSEKKFSKFKPSYKSNVCEETLKDFYFIYIQSKSLTSNTEFDFGQIEDSDYSKQGNFEDSFKFEDIKNIKDKLKLFIRENKRIKVIDNNLCFDNHGYAYFVNESCEEFEAILSGSRSQENEAGGTGSQGQACGTGAQGQAGGTGTQDQAGGTDAQGQAGETGTQDQTGGTGAQGQAGGTGAQGQAGETGTQDQADETGTRDQAGGAGTQGYSSGHTSDYSQIINFSIIRLPQNNFISQKNYNEYKILVLRNNSNYSISDITSCDSRKCTFNVQKKNEVTDYFLWKTDENYSLIGKFENANYGSGDVLIVCSCDSYNIFQERLINSFNYLSNFDISKCLTHEKQSVCIEDFFNKNQWNNFYIGLTEINNNKFIKSNDGDFIFIDNNRYFQRFNNFWTFKSIDGSITNGLLLFPSKNVNRCSRGSKQKQSDFIKFGKTIPINSPQSISSTSLSDKYKLIGDYGMVCLNTKINKLEEIDDHNNFIITSLIDKNNIVLSPVRCDDSSCKFYSPQGKSDINYLLWKKQDGKLNFINQLTYTRNPIKRYAINFSSDFIKHCEAIYNMKNDICDINQIFNFEKFILFYEILKDNNLSDLDFDNNFFSYSNNGDFIILDSADKKFFQRVDKYWVFKSLDLNEPEYLLIPPKRTTYREDEREINGRKIKFIRYDIHNSSQFYFKIKESYYNYESEYIGTSFDPTKITRKSNFHKWIIVDKFELAETSLVTGLFTTFRNTKLQDIINNISLNEYRLDGLQTNNIKRIDSNTPDYANRYSTTDICNALLTLQKHSPGEQNFHWELHIFVLRNTSSSKKFDYDKIGKVCKKLYELKVKSLYIWEFSDQKPLETTTYYESLINTIKLNNTHPFYSYYKSVYEANYMIQCEDIKRLLTN